MAYENAVSDLSQLATNTTCDGCGQDLNLLANYIALQHKVERQVIERVSASLVGAETDDDGQIVALAEIDAEEAEEEGSERYWMGTRSGAGEMLKFHNFECVRERLEGDAYQDEAPKMKYYRGDPAPAEESES